jgi:hypothetical protein
VLLTIVIVFGALLLVLMVVGWRSRSRRQSEVAAPRPVPDDLGDEIGVFGGSYVATCTSGDPYDRITVHGLGFRGPARVTVTERGVILARTGSDDTWIPAGDLTDVRRATWTIDRVVEADGLHLLEWRLGDRVVDSYLRVDHAAEFESALAQLRPALGKAS